MEERNADGDVEVKIFENISRIGEKYEIELIGTKVRFHCFKTLQLNFAKVGLDLNLISSMQI